MIKKNFPLILISCFLFSMSPLFSQVTASSLAGISWGTQDLLKSLHSHSAGLNFAFSDDLKRPEVQKQIKYYQNPKFETFWGLNLQRLGFYNSHVNASISKADVPAELLYLPIIESLYDPNATSYVGATGLWQFMTNSIQPYDMRINQWQDDRKDFWISTEAAIHKLTYNYNRLGDWYLALAAYNAGLTRITNLVKSTGINDYWQLAEQGLLPKQTAEYIPKLLAVSYVANQDTGKLAPPIQWSRISLHQAVDLRLLSEKIGIPFNVLDHANSELKYAVTPPSSRNYFLKIPTIYENDLEALLAAKEQPLLRFYQYKIQPGDTLSHLSAHYDISVSLIREYNHNIRPEKVRINDIILVPALKEVKPYPKKTIPLINLPLWYGRYTIKEGDTLWGIAISLDVDAQLLAAENKLTLQSTLSPGKVLIVP